MDTKDNRYLEKICALLKAPSPPRSEKAAKKPKKIHKPKLQKFTSKMSGKQYK